MSLYVQILTLVHVLISLAGIASGFVILGALLGSKWLGGCTKFFLATTVLTSVTGFLFPVDHITPGHVLGVISLILLPMAIYALYGRKLAGGWLKTYIITAMAAQYLNVFVLIVQLFQKVPALHELAPEQSDPAFGITQLLVLAIFVVLTTLAVRRFREAPLAG